MTTDKRPSLDEIFGTQPSAEKPIGTVAGRPSLDEIFGTSDKRKEQPLTNEWGEPVDSLEKPAEVEYAGLKDFLTPTIFEQKSNAKSKVEPPKKAKEEKPYNPERLLPIAESGQAEIPPTFISSKIFEEFTPEEKLMLDVDKATDSALNAAQEEASAQSVKEDLAKTPWQRAFEDDTYDATKNQVLLRKTAGADAVIKRTFESISADDINSIIENRVANNEEFKAKKQAFDDEVKRIMPNSNDNLSDAEVEALFANMTPEEREVAEKQIAETTQALEALQAKFASDVEAVYKSESKDVEAQINNRIINRLAKLNLPKNDLEYIGKAIYNNSLVGTLYEIGLNAAAGGSGTDYIVSQQAMAQSKPSAIAKVVGGAGAILADGVIFGALSAGGSLVGAALRNKVASVVAGQIARKAAVSATNSAVKATARRIVEKKVLQQFAEAATAQAITLGGYNGLLTAAQETLSQTGENGAYNWRNIFHRMYEGALIGVALGGVSVGTNAAKGAMYRARPDMAYTATGMAADLGISLAGFTAENAAFLGIGSLVSGEEITAEAIGESFATLGLLKGIGALKRVAKGENVMQQPDFVERTISDLEFRKEEMDAMRNAGIDMEQIDIVSEAVREMLNRPNKSLIAQETISSRPLMEVYNSVMSSREVPISAKMKLQYIVRGTVPRGIGATSLTISDTNGTPTVKAYDINGRLVQIREFANKAEAESFMKKTQPLLERNTIVEGEKVLRGGQIAVTMQQAIEQYAKENPNTDARTLFTELMIDLGYVKGKVPASSRERVDAIKSRIKEQFVDPASQLVDGIARKYGTTVESVYHALNIKPDLRTVREAQLAKAYVDALKQFNGSMSGPVEAEQARYNAQMRPQIEQGKQEIVDAQRETEFVRNSLNEAAKRMATADGKQIAIVRLENGEQVAVHTGRIVLREDGTIDHKASEQTIVIKRIDAEGNEQRDSVGIDDIAEVIEQGTPEEAVEASMSVLEAQATKKLSLDKALSENGELGVEVVAIDGTRGKIVGIDENGSYILRAKGESRKEVDVPVSINDIAEINTEQPVPATTEQAAVADATEKVVEAGLTTDVEVEYDDDFPPLTEADMAPQLDADKIQWEKLSPEDYTSASAMLYGDATTLADSHIYHTNSRADLAKAKQSVAEQQKVIDKLNSRFATLSSPAEAQKLRKQVAAAEQEKAKREQAVKNIEEQMAKYAHAMRKYGVEVATEDNLLAERARLEEERNSLLEADKELDRYEQEEATKGKKAIANTAANRKYIEQLYADRFGVSPAQAGPRQAILWDLANGAIKLRWDNVTTDSGAVQKGLAAELGLSAAEKRIYKAVTDNKNGQSVDAYTHDLWQGAEWGQDVDDMALKDMILGVLQSTPNGSLALKELADMSGVQADLEAQISLGKGDIQRKLEEVDANLAKNAQQMADFRKRINDTVQKLESGEPLIFPIGEGEFGPIYDQFRGRPQEAVDFLLAEKNGEAIGALSHKDIGEIDLVWGKEGTGHSDGYGLSKLAKYHPEVLDKLQPILDDMEVVSRNANRVNLESPKYQAAVRLTWNNERKNWLLTAFEKRNSAIDNTTDTGETAISGKQNDTATLQSTASESKDTTTIPKNQISDEEIPKVLSLEQYLGELGLSSPMSDYMIDKTRQPHLRTQSQKNKFEKDAKEAMLNYAQQREQAIVDYKKLVDEGRITPPSNIDRLIASAHGHNDLESTQAARRQLAKRGIDWESGLPKETPFMIEPTAKISSNGFVPTPKREITYGNFYERTGAVFSQVERPNREPDYISRRTMQPDKVSSEYWYGEDEGGKYVVRGSDHWSTVAKRPETVETFYKSYVNRKYVPSRNPLIGSCWWGLVATDSSQPILYGKAYLNDINDLKHDRDIVMQSRIEAANKRFNREVFDTFAGHLGETLGVKDVVTDAAEVQRVFELHQAVGEGLRTAIVQNAEIAAERADIERVAKENGTWLKAPNGKDTNLTERQWVDVRTSRFKSWFGDWGQMFIKNFLLNKTPIARLSGNEFLRVEGKTLTEQVAEYFESIGGKAISPLYGEVILDRKGADDSLAHGMGRKKAVAYASVKEVIESGVLVQYDTNHKGRNYDTAVFAAPIEINNERHICYVTIKRGKYNRYYLHEVWTEKNLANVGSNAVQGQPSQVQGVANILQNIIFTSETSSKVVDDNGEPKVVYHGTPNQFNTFNRELIGSSTDRGIWGRGFYFTSNKAEAERYTKRGDATGEVKEVSLNIRKPLVIKAEQGDAGKEYIQSLYRKHVTDEIFEDPRTAEAKLAEATQKVTDELVENGYDGVVVTYKDGTQEYVVFNPNQIKSATENTGEYNPTNDDIRMSIEAYHGSGADFEKFDHKFMGTGEGAQAYGWGTYVTEVENIARGYAKASGEVKERKARELAKQSLLIVRENIAKERMFVERKQKELVQMEEHYAKLEGDLKATVFPHNRKRLQETMQELANDIRNANGEIEASLWHIEQLKPQEEQFAKVWEQFDAQRKIEELKNRIEWAKLDIRNLNYKIEQHAQALDKLEQSNETSDQVLEDLRSILNFRYLLEGKDAIGAKAAIIAEIERYKGLIEDAERGISNRQKELEELQAIEQPKFRNLYSVEVPDNTGENYLPWDKELTPGMKDRIYPRIIKSLEDRLESLRNSPDAENLKGHIAGWENVLQSYQKGYDRMGKDIYKELLFQLKSEKAASEFLHSVGFTGVEYPAEYTTGGRSDGAKNYVIFNADDVKIVDHVQYFKTPNGEVYGFVYEDKIYLDPTNIDPKAPVHEYTELWCREVAKANKPLWERGKELVKQTKVWEEVNADENYKHQSEDLRASEAWSRIIADEMAGKAREVGSKGLMAKLRAWMRSFWKAVKSVVEKWTKKELEDLTVDQFKKMTMADFINKVDPRKWNAKKPKEVGKSHKQAQLDIIKKHNPMQDDVHTGIRKVEDIKSFDEVLGESRKNQAEYGELTYPDMNIDMMESAAESGMITVYSSYPIKQGVFVTPSYMNAQDYAGGSGRVYQATVPVDDVAWIAEDEGQYARVETEPMQPMIVGEKGAAALDQAEEATTRLDNLAVAREMEEANRDAKAIRLATGWERGADGKWRYEIDDKPVREEAVNRLTNQLEYQQNSSVMLYDLLSGADELFAAYPDLMKLRVVVEGKSDSVIPAGRLEWAEDIYDSQIVLNRAAVQSHFAQDELEGYGRADRALIKIRQGINPKTQEKFSSEAEQAEYLDLYTGIAEEYLAKYKKSKAMRLATTARVVAHEVQHSIQFIEGFARGSSVEEFDDKRGTLISDIDFATDGDFLKGSSISNAQSVHEALNKKVPYTEMTVKEAYADKLQRVASKYGYENIEALADDFTKFPSAFEQYHRTAGEVEARNVQKRILEGLTPEERRATLLSETEDVAREDQIFLENNLGVAEMGSRVTKRMAEIETLLQGKKLMPEQQKVVDVYTGKSNNETIIVEREDGQHSVVMRQGNENGAGTKHSVYRHYNTSSGYITADDILRIPETLKEGRKVQGVKPNTYKYELALEDGNTLIVTTQRESGKNEVFTNAYTNRKASNSILSRETAEVSNTPNGAQVSNYDADSADKDNANISNYQIAQSVEVSEPVEVPTRKPRKSAAEKSLEKIESLREQLQNKKRSLENTLADVYNFLTSKDIAETMAEGVGKAQYRSVIKNAIEAIGKAYNITDAEEKRKVVFRYLGEIDDNLSQLLTRQRLNEVTKILDKAIYGYTAQGVRTGKRIDEHTREIFDMLRNAIAEPVEEERDERGNRKPVHYRLKNRTEAGDITASFRLRTKSKDDISVITKLRSDADEIINSVDYLDTATTRKAAQLEYTANLLESYDNTLQLNEAIGKSTDEIAQILDNIDRVREKYKAAAVGSEERKDLYGLLKQLKTDLESEKMNRANLRHRYASMLKTFTTSLEQLDEKGASEFVRAEQEKAEAAIKWRKGIYDSIKSPNAPVLPFDDYDRKGKRQEINWKGQNTRAKINESVFMATFAEMSRDIDINSIPGQWAKDGWYYQFMLAPGGYMERTDWRYKTEKALRGELDAEILKMSGDKKTDEPYKLFAALAQEPSGMSIQHMAVSKNDKGTVVGGYQENIPLTIGQLLYMRNTLRQPNGFAGYNAWGFAETYMQNIVEYVEAKYPQYCRFFDWVVSEFMPKLYDMQDAIYFKKFGTHLPKTAFYFPFVRDKRMVGKVAEVGEGEVSLPSSVTGNIVERVKTSAKMDLQADAFSVLQNHIKETLDWCAYSELTDKFNSVATSHAFGNILKAQGVSVQKLREMYEIAIGQGKINSTENTTLTKVLNTASKGLVAGNIVLNLNSAAKQLVSGSCALGYTANPKIIPIWAKNFFVPSAIKTGVGRLVQQIKGGELDPVEVINWKAFADNWKWAIENIPTLRQRWEGRNVGFEVLKSHGFESWDKLSSIITRFGLAPNATIDMFTCANVAKTVYEYEYPRLLERGRSKEEAHREACVKAAIFTNETQQSGIDAFLSSFQSGGGLQRLLGVGLGAYQNTSMAFARNERFAITNMFRMLNPATRERMIAHQVKAYKELGFDDMKARELAKSDFKESQGQQFSAFIHNGIVSNLLWTLAGTLLTTAISGGIAAMFSGKEEWEKMKNNEKFRDELSSALSIETIAWQTPLFYNAPIFKQLMTYAHNASNGKTYGGIFESPSSQSAQEMIDAIFKQWIGVKNEVTGERERTEPTRYDRTAEWLVFSTLVKAGLGVNPDLVVRMAEGVDAAIKDGMQVEDVMNVLSSPRGLTRAIAGEPRQGETKEEYLNRMAYIYRQINAQDKKFVRERTKEYIDNKDNELYRTLGIVPREERILEQKVKAIRKQLLFFDRSDEGVAEFRALPEADRKKQIEIAKRYDEITKLTKEMYQGILPFDEAGVSKRKQELQKRHDMMREVYDLWIEYNNK